MAHSQHAHEDTATRYERYSQICWTCILGQCTRGCPPICGKKL